MPDAVPSAVTLIRSDTLYAAAPYAYAATAPADTRLIFLAGACPINQEGTVELLDDYVGQAAQAMSNLDVALADAGATLRDVISTRVLVVANDREDLVAAWKVVHAMFSDHEPPSTLLGVTVLGYPGQLVEIEAVAAVRDGDADDVATPR